MGLTIGVRETGHIVILDISGRITSGEAVTSLRDEIRELVDAGQNSIVLNLAGVSYIDSSGLGQLVGSYAAVTNRGGRLKLMNVDKRAHELLQVTKLYTVFETFKSEAAAIQSFAPKRTEAAHNS